MCVLPYICFITGGIYGTGITKARQHARRVGRLRLKFTSTWIVGEHGQDPKRRPVPFFEYMVRKGSLEISVDSVILWYKSALIEECILP